MVSACYLVSAPSVFISFIPPWIDIWAPGLMSLMYLLDREVGWRPTRSLIVGLFDCIAVGRTWLSGPWTEPFVLFSL